jgi:hypothetical protein
LIEQAVDISQQLAVARTRTRDNDRLIAEFEERTAFQSPSLRH